MDVIHLHYSVNVEHWGASLSKQRRAASFGKLAQGSPVLLASYSAVSQATPWLARPVHPSTVYRSCIPVASRD